MKQETAKILSHEAIAEDIYKLVVKTGIAAEARPGGFVNLYVDDGAHILPRPISICDFDNESLTLCYRTVGEGTELISKKPSGSEIRLLGPLGNGYDVESIRSEYNNILLVGGGLGVPPMLALAKSFEGKAKVVLGYRDEPFLKDEFEEAAGEIYYASESGSIGVQGTVIDAIRHYGVEANVICSCGPLPMLRALKEYADDKGIKLYVSLEERMACGVGACLGCVTETVNKDSHSMVHNARVCKDGPVFDAAEVVL